METTNSLHQELVALLKGFDSVPASLNNELCKFFGTADVREIEFYEEYYDVESINVYQVMALMSRLRWILCVARSAKRHMDKNLAVHTYAG